MPSVLNVDTLVAANGTDPVTLTKQSATKAWINFNGQGTIAIQTSFNISSISDVSTGQYQVDFASAMSDANHCTTLAVSHSSSADEGADLSTSVYGTTNYRVNNREGGGTYRDPIRFCCDTNGDLA